MTDQILNYYQKCKELRCKICDKGMGNHRESDLDKHLKTHSDEYKAYQIRMRGENNLYINIMYRCAIKLFQFFYIL